MHKVKSIGTSLEVLRWEGGVIYLGKYSDLRNNQDTLLPEFLFIVCNNTYEVHVYISVILGNSLLLDGFLEFFLSLKY
jgi:hypothetical protein